MSRENCETCGKFKGNYKAEAKKTSEKHGVTKGELIDVYGCKFCEDFVRT